MVRQNFKFGSREVMTHMKVARETSSARNLLIAKPFGSIPKRGGWIARRDSHGREGIKGSNEDMESHS